MFGLKGDIFQVVEELKNFLNDPTIPQELKDKLKITEQFLKENA